MSKGGSSKTTETSKQEGTSVVQLPAWMTQAGQSVFEEARAQSAANPVTAYTGQKTAGMDPNQQQAGAIAAGQQGAGQTQLGQAAAATGTAMQGGSRVATSAFDSAAADKYMSPFLQQVQGRTVDEMQRQGKMQLDDLGDNVAAQKAFGGLRHGVAEAEATKGINNNILDYLARSNQAGFESAQGQFNADTDRKLGADTTNAGLDQAERDRALQGAGMYANLGAQEASMRDANIRNLLATGGVAQDTANAKLAADYEEFRRLQDAPMDRSQDLMAILAGTPRNTTTSTSGTSSGTSTAKQNPGWLSTVMGGAQIAASAFSDSRLKRFVRLVGRLANGLGIYEWNYLDLPWLPKGRHRGVMAHEVAVLVPSALGPTVGGYLTVNYALLGEAL